MIQIQSINSYDLFISACNPSFIGNHSAAVDDNDNNKKKNGNVYTDPVPNIEMILFLVLAKDRTVARDSGLSK